jgi:hypothetical protein
VRPHAHPPVRHPVRTTAAAPAAAGGGRGSLAAGWWLPLACLPLLSLARLHLPNKQEAA